MFPVLETCVLSGVTSNHFTQRLWSLGKSHNFLVSQLHEMEGIVVCVFVCSPVCMHVYFSVMHV